MGFRNPITTATAVDTGRGPADAGVRLYQDLSVPAVPKGVAEWRTGLMDRNATATLSGGGSGGSAYTINGGATVSVNAPQIGLNIESQPAGGYAPMLKLLAGARGHIAPDTWLDPVVKAGPFPGGPNVIPYQVTAGVWSVPRFAKLASGRVVLTGLLGYTGASLAAGTILGTLPASCWPDRYLTGLALGGNNRPWRWQIDPAGNLAFQAPAASDWSFITGDGNGYLSLDGIAFMPADVNPA